MAKSRDEIRKEWRELVNMGPDELEDWLATAESRSVGDTGGDMAGEGESTGHESGRRIVEIERTEESALTDAQWAHMGKVVGYIKRHLAQGGPEGDATDSKWRHSLMNWGHDPLKG